MICPKCDGSVFVKHGFVCGVQRWKCVSCGKNVTEKTFSVAYRHRHSIERIRASVALMMLTNASSRRAKTIVSLFTGDSVSNVTLWEWMHKFRDRLDITSKSFRKVYSGRVWHVDEVFIKVRGSTSKKDFSYLVVVRDQHGTILAVEIGHNRNAKLIAKALNKADEDAKQKPSIVVTDEFRAYPKAVKKVFPKEHKRDNPKHVNAHFKFKNVQHHQRKYKLSNNCIERTNSFIREWTHGKRGFKSLESAQRSLETWSAVHNARHAGTQFWHKAFP